MIVVEPEKRACEQEIRHLAPTIIENDRAPIRMFALARVRMFVQMRSVEETQAMIVARKMRGDPVQDHANPVLVAIVHKKREVVGISIPARWRKIPDRLIAPRTV